MADIDETLRHDLRDPEFSEGYAESFLDTYVATQLKVLREQRHLTQKEVAKELVTSQGVVSRFEDADYASWNVSTLRKFARLYEVRLHISFETYGSLIGDIKRFGRKSLERAPRHADPVLYASSSRRKTNAFQLQLFAEAQLHNGENKSLLIDPAMSVPVPQRPAPQGSRVGGGNLRFLRDYRPRQLGADGARRARTQTGAKYA